MLENETLENLVQLAIDGTDIVALCKKASERAEILKAEQEKRDKEAAEIHRREQAEKLRFENRFPTTWRFKHVYPEQLLECVNTASLKDMEEFATEMLQGRHKGEFFNNTFDDALAYLNSRINERINDSIPAHEAKSMLAKAKDIVEMGKKELTAKNTELRELRDETEKLVKELKPNAVERTRPYTT